MSNKQAIHPRPLTKIQKLVLDYIEKYSNKNGYSPTLKEIGNNLNRSTATIHQHIKLLGKKGYLSKKKNSSRNFISNSKDYVTIPLLGTIAAGSPIGIFEDPTPITVLKSLIPNSENHFALKVAGNSMIEDGILDKDTVLVRSQNSATSGDTVVGIITDEFGNESATLKTYYKRKEKIELKPQNPTHQSIMISPKDFKIRGKFVGLIRT